MVSMRSDLLSAAEAAEALGVSVRTVHRLAKSGRLHVAHKLPTDTGAYLFYKGDIDAYIESRDKKAAG